MLGHFLLKINQGKEQQLHSRYLKKLLNENHKTCGRIEKEFYAKTFLDFLRQ